MKLKMHQIVAAAQALGSLDVPAPIALKLARAAQPLMAEAALWEQQRLRLVRKYGERQGNGQTIVQPDSENWDKFSEEIGALLGTDTEVNIVPLPVSTLGGVFISVGAMTPIWFLFEEEIL